MILDRLPTTHMLSKRKICPNRTCSISEMDKEDIKQIFFNCNSSRTIWDQIGTHHNYPQSQNDKGTMFNWLKELLSSTKSFNNYINWPEFPPSSFDIYGLLEMK